MAVYKAQINISDTPIEFQYIAVNSAFCLGCDVAALQNGIHIKETGFRWSKLGTGIRGISAPHDLVNPVLIKYYNGESEDV